MIDAIRGGFIGRAEEDEAVDWYRDAVIYAIDVETFYDSDGDSVGDFQGLIERLDYLENLGVDVLWLLPFYPTPNRDNGYDVADYYGVDPRHGTLGDFVETVQRAYRRGLRVIVDLVINHTSDQHPWFQAARTDPDSPYRDYYVWTDEPPTTPERGSVFPGELHGDRIWTYDTEAGAYYYHRFYSFQPDLNVDNPAVREEIRRIMRFWLQLGVDGFRVDAATLMIEQKDPNSPIEIGSHQILKELRQTVERHGENAILLAEADDDPDRLAEYFDEEMHLLLNFVLDAHLVLALACGRAEPIVEGLERLPDVHGVGQWANFLRNFDELNVGRLSDEEREEVFEAFAPDPSMRLYGRGIRRRLAPMLDGDPRRLRLAVSLLFAMPGTPLFFYGDEIGMGDEQSLPGRNAVRTPMQWSDAENGGFSTADADDLVRPVIEDPPYGYREVNVEDQNTDPDSMLSWMRRLIEVRDECSSVGRGRHRVLGVDDPAVFVNRYESGGEPDVVTVHNLSEGPRAVTPGIEGFECVFGDGDLERTNGETTVSLPAYGRCWLRAFGSN